MWSLDAGTEDNQCDSLLDHLLLYWLLDESMVIAITFPIGGPIIISHLVSDVVGVWSPLVI